MKRCYRPLMIATLLMLGIWRAGADATETIRVFVSIVPQKYFVQQIGGDRVDVHVMVRPAASPATYEPKPQQMAALTRTRLYCTVGVPFEAAWLEKISAANSAMRVVHTEEGVAKIPMQTHAHDAHAHDAAHHDEAGPHAILDPHIWLSPPLVKIQARNILQGLVQVDPSHRRVYEANYQAFLERLEALDAELRHTFAGRKGLKFMVFHPAWGYFARCYGLVQLPIEVEGKAPKPAQLGALIDRARKERIKLIYVQPQFSMQSARTIARAIGAEVVAADPLAEDWAQNLRRMAKDIKAAL